MKSHSLYPMILAISLLVTCGLVLPAQAIPRDSASPELLYIWQGEAESGVRTGDIRIGSDPGASGRQYIYCPADHMGDFNPNSPVVATSFSVPYAASYFIWARAMGDTDWTHNSFRVSVDGQPSPPFHYEIPTFNGIYQWGWDLVNVEGQAPGPFYLTAGQHTLRFWARESYARLDAVLVTDDPSYLPPGAPTFTPGSAATRTATPSPTLTRTRTRTPTPTRTRTPTPTGSPRRSRTPAPLYLPLAMRKPAPTELAYDDGKRELGLQGGKNDIVAVRFTVVGARQLKQVRCYLYHKMRPAKLIVYSSAWEVIYQQQVTPNASTEGSWYMWDVAAQGITVSGDFFGALQWLDDSKMGPAVGLDTTAPDARTYSTTEGQEFPPAVFAGGDAMIRAVVE